MEDWWDLNNEEEEGLARCQGSWCRHHPSSCPSVEDQVNVRKEELEELFSPPDALAGRGGGDEDLEHRKRFPDLLEPLGEEGRSSGIIQSQAADQPGLRRMRR